MLEDIVKNYKFINQFITLFKLPYIGTEVQFVFVFFLLVFSGIS